MFIHWFPGHMTKAIRMMEREISLVECVIYILDSRAPLSSINPSFDKIINNKPILYILNKCDMVTQSDILSWRSHFEKEGKHIMLANSILKNNAFEVIKKLREINVETLEKYQNKGVKKTIRAMVIGVPNSGKSTLINSLIKKKKTVTGNKPGVTRGKQWISIDPYIDLLDTPGTLYPDFSNQIKATNLAIIGSIKEDILDIVELSMEIVRFLAQNYLEQFKAVYQNLDIDKENLNRNEYVIELLEKIGGLRGFLMRGNQIDLERTSKSIIVDFRKQKFGKVILEKVSDIAMIQALENENR